MDLKRIKKQIQLNGNIRDAAWMTRQFEKGRIKLGVTNNGELPELVNRSIFEQFKTCIRVINEIYEDNWDIDFQLLENHQSKKVYIHIKGVFILFPEITINNRNNNSHTIKDLIVRINLYMSVEGSLKVEGIDGGRLHLTYAEYQSDYFHSHLSTNRYQISSNMQIPLLERFCTGSGEINMFRSELNGDGFTEERFMRFALQIMGLVSYESIEGTPHRRLERISTRPQSGLRFYIDHTRKQRFKRKVLRYYKTFNITPKIDITINSSNTYSIANNESFQRFILDIDYSEEEKREFFCSPSDDNTYYMYGNTPGYSDPPNITDKFIFRGEEKSFVIEPAPNIPTTINYIIHPDLVNHLKEEIEYALNENKIRQNTIDRYTIKSVDTTESIQSNPIPVPTNS